MNTRKSRQALSILLALTMLFTATPASWLTAQADTASGDIGDQNALDALGIDTSVMPEGYDANSLENPYGRSTLTLNPVYELFETRVAAATPMPAVTETVTSDDGSTVTRIDTVATPYTVGMALYGHNAPLGDILDHQQMTQAVITQASITTRTTSPAGIAATTTAYAGADRVLAATNSASGNFAASAAAAGTTGQVVTVGTDAMDKNGGLYLYFTDPVTGAMSAHMKTLAPPSAIIGNSGGKMDEDFVLAPYLMQNYLKVATGDFDGNGIDEVAVYVAEQGASRVEVYKLETTSSAGEGFFLDVTNWQLAWTYYFAESPYVSNMVSLTAGDFSRDGVDDLAMTWGYYYGPGEKNGCKAAVLFGDNEDMLQDYQDISLLYGTSPIVRAAFTLGDIDGDGVEDLVLGGQLETDIGNPSIRLNSRFVAVYTYQGADQPFLQAAAQNFNFFERKNAQYVNKAMEGRGDRFYSSPAMVANVAVYNTEGVGKPVSIYLDSLLIENGDEGLVIRKALDQDTSFRRYPQSYQTYYTEYGAATADFTGSVKQSLLTMQYYLPATLTIYPFWWFFHYTGYAETRTADGVLDKVFYTEGAGGIRTPGVDFSLSYCTLNTDNDTSLLKYLNRHYVRYTDPKVLAVLSSPPYFKDLDQDSFSGSYKNSETTYSTTTGSGTSDTQAHTLSLGVYVSFSHEFTMPVTGVKLGSVEAEASYTAGLTWETEHSASLEQTISYATLVGEDAVAFYSIPMEIYEYESLMPKIDEHGNITGYDTQKMAVNIPHIASVKVLPLDTYEKIAADYAELPRIADNVLTHTVGDPATYPKDTAAFSNPIQYNGDWSGVNFGNGSISQEIAMTRETGKSFTHTHAIDFKVGAGPGDFVFGRSIGYEFGSGRTKVTTNGSSFTGTVYNMPAEAEPYGYNYAWKVFSYQAEVNGCSFPVVDYLVADVTAPPKLPTDFAQNPAGTTDSQLELNWSYKGSVAGFQLYRYYEFPDGSGSYELAFVPMSSAYAVDPDGTRHFRYVDTQLDPYTDYDYQIQTVRAAVPTASILSEVYRARTKTGTGYPDIGLSGLAGGVLPVYPDTDSTVGVVIANAGDYRQAPRYQWQKQTDTGWTDVSGATADNLVFRAAGLGDEGTYRCRVNVIHDAQYISSYSDTFFADYNQRTPVFIENSFAVTDADGAGNRPTLSIAVKSAHTNHFYVPTGTMTFQLRGAGGEIYQYPVKLQAAAGELAKTGAAIATFTPDTALPAGPYEVTAWYGGSRVYQSLQTAAALYWVSGSGNGSMIMLDNTFTYGNTMNPVLYNVRKEADGTASASPVTGASWRVERHTKRYEAYHPWGWFWFTTIRLVDVITVMPGFTETSPGTLTADQTGTYTLVASDGVTDIASRSFEVLPREITVGITNQDKESGLDTITHPGIDILHVRSGSLAPSDTLANLGLYVRATNTAGREVTITGSTLPGRYAIAAAATAGAIDLSEYENYSFQFDTGAYVLTGARYPVSGVANTVNGTMAGTLALTQPNEHTDWTSSPRYANGTNLFFQAAPLPGYSVKRWTIYDIKNDMYLLDEMTHRTTLTHTTKSEAIRVSVDFEITQSTLSFPAHVTGGSIACTSNSVFNSGDVARNGAQFTFRASPRTGYHFVEWQLTEVGKGLVKPAGIAAPDGGSTCTLTMGSGNTLLHAIFERDSYLLTLRGDLQATYLFDADGKSTTPMEPVTVGTGVRITGDTEVTVTHKPGYAVAMDAVWTNNGNAVSANTGTDNQAYSFTMDRDTTIAARTENQKYPVSLTVSGAGIGANIVDSACNGLPVVLPATLSGGSVLHFEAKPAYGYVFDEWRIRQRNVTQVGVTEQVTTAAGIMLDIPALGGDLQVEAVFRDNDAYDLTLRHGQRGLFQVSVNGGEPVTVDTPDTNAVLGLFRGDTVAITAVPEDNFMVESWRVDGTIRQTYDRTLTFTDIHATLHVEAIFGAQSYTTVTYTATPAGMGTIAATSDGVPFASGSNSIGNGTTVRFVAAPTEGRMVDGWTNNGAAVLNPAGGNLVDNVYEISALSGKTDVVVTFADAVTHAAITSTTHAAIAIAATPQWPDGIRDGATVTCTITPANTADERFRVVTAAAVKTVDGTPVPFDTVDKRADGTWLCTIRVLTEDLTISAEAVKLYAIRAPATPVGGNILLGVTEAIAGESVTIKAVPASNHIFSGWTVSGGVTLSGATAATATFTMPANDVNVAATFTAASSGNTGGTTGGTVAPAPAPVVELLPGETLPGATPILVFPLGTGRITPDDSQKLVEANRTQILQLTGNGFHIRIPVGILQTGDDLNDYIPSLAGLDPSTGNGWIVVRTDAAGVEHIVRWSAVRSGSVSFIADGRGVHAIRNNDKVFDDIQKHWGLKAIGFVTARDLFQGTGLRQFGAGASMTRAMLVTVLHRLDGLTAGTGEIFTDVPKGSWFANAVSWAAANKIVSGIGNGAFGAAGRLTREQLAVFLYRYATYLGLDTASTLTLDTYADAGKVSAYALDAMNWAVEKGILTGKSGSLLDPSGFADRAEVATMLQRFVELVLK